MKQCSWLAAKCLTRSRPSMNASFISPFFTIASLTNMQNENKAGKCCWCPLMTKFTYEPDTYPTSIHLHWDLTIDTWPMNGLRWNTGSLISHEFPGPLTTRASYSQAVWDRHYLAGACIFSLVSGCSVNSLPGNTLIPGFFFLSTKYSFPPSSDGNSEHILVVKSSKGIDV